MIQESLMAFSGDVQEQRLSISSCHIGKPYGFCEGTCRSNVPPISNGTPAEEKTDEAKKVMKIFAYIKKKL